MLLKKRMAESGLELLGPSLTLTDSLQSKCRKAGKSCSLKTLLPSAAAVPDHLRFSGTLLCGLRRLGQETFIVKGLVSQLLLLAKRNFSHGL